MTVPSPRRTLAIWLPRLPTDRLTATRPDAASRPFATVATQKSALRLAAVNALAAARGLQPGLTLADARARHPDLRVAEADEAADAALLKALGERCERYTPLVALDPPDGLMLDITGAAHLFGGEAAMRRDAARRIAREGFAVRVAVAETPGCAWALARFGAEAVVATGGARDALTPLPLAALRLPAEMLAGLRRVGLVRVADIVALPRAPLTARFGSELLLRLDQALGLHEEALTHLRPASPFTAERIFAEPIEQEDAILATAEALAIGLGPAMERGKVGARKLELALFRVDGKVDRLVIGTSRPARDARLIRRLFAETLAKVGEIDAGYGFDVVRLSVRATEPLPARQLALGQPRSFEADLALLIDRLAARLGPARLIRLAPRDSHVPERAVASCSPEAATVSPSPLEGEGCAELARSRAYSKLGEGDAAPAVAHPASAFAETPQESFSACRPDPSPQPSPSRGEGGVCCEAEVHGCAETAAGSPSPLEGEGCAELARLRAYSKLGEGDAAPAVEYPASAFAETPQESFPACRPDPSPQPSPSRGEGGDRGEAGEGRKASSAVVISFVAASPSQLKLESRRQFLPSPGCSGTESVAPLLTQARHASAPSLHNPGSNPGQALPPREGKECAADAFEDDSSSERPIRLFEPPESVEAMAEVPDGAPLRFRWRRKMHRVLHAEGPERIALEWWRDAASPGFTRDYFRVETTEGRRFWLYRDGLYAREVEHPRWFVHGVFA